METLESPLKCVVVGDRDSGREDDRSVKTSLLYTYTSDGYPKHYMPTVFDNIAVIVMVGDEPYNLGLFDTTGGEDYDRARVDAYRFTDVFLVCFSVALPHTLENVRKKWVPEITQHSPKTPFLLVGLETDLRDDAGTIEKLSRVNQTPVSVAEAEKLAHVVGAAKYVECSDVMNSGVKNVFYEAVLATLKPDKPVKKQGWFSTMTDFFQRNKKGIAQSDKEEAKDISKESTGEVVINKIKHQHLELLDVIGQGGFGAVFRGKWKARKGEMVAIKKCLLAGTKQDPDIPREVLVLSSLPQHPHIITFYGISLNYPELLIVTEFAEKGSLFNYLHKEKQVPTVDQSLAWALQVAQGMEHLHNHDIIHRDLKSANVLLSSSMAAKLCDFGTARYLSHTTVQTKEAGTHRWMAPEIMEAVESKISKKCDSFSFGMVVYELFAHQVPFHHTPGDVFASIKIAQGERPDIPSAIPQYLHSLLTACWEADPHKRPTFQDIVQVLQSKSF